MKVINLQQLLDALQRGELAGINRDMELELQHEFLHHAQTVFLSRRIDEYNAFLASEGRAAFATGLRAAFRLARDEMLKNIPNAHRIPKDVLGDDYIESEVKRRVDQAVEHGTLTPEDFDAAVVRWEQAKAGSVTRDARPS